jgi:hypothetical protein
MINHKLLTNFTALLQQYTHLYDENNLSVGFTWTGDSSCPIPLCPICGRRLTNATLVPAKLKQQLTTNHSHMTSRSADYFKRLLESQNRVKLLLVKSQLVKKLREQVI